MPFGTLLIAKSLEKNEKLDSYNHITNNAISFVCTSGHSN